MTNSGVFSQRELVNAKPVNSAIGVGFFVLATVLGSYVRIPVAGSPVPITLQTFFVILSGAVLGARLGAVTQLIFALLAGPYLLGPTGGYILGFVPAAYISGLLCRIKPASKVAALASFAAGSLAIYACAAAWLAAVYKMSLSQILDIGILPFIPGDVAKVCLAVVLYRSVSRRTSEIFRV